MTALVALCTVAALAYGGIVAHVAWKISERRTTKRLKGVR